MESQRPGPTPLGDPSQAATSAVQSTVSEAGPTKKRRNHRGGKKKRTRRQSFATPGDGMPSFDGSRSNPNIMDTANNGQQASFYRLGHSGRNMSETSLDSQALLDHRDHPPMRARRDSRPLGAFSMRPNYNAYESTNHGRPSPPNLHANNEAYRRSFHEHHHRQYENGSDGDDFDTADARTPLMSRSMHQDRSPKVGTGYGSNMRGSGFETIRRRSSRGTSTSSRKKRQGLTREHSTNNVLQQDYDVNNPPSVPGSPVLGQASNYEDFLVTDAAHTASPQDRRATIDLSGHDAIIDIDGNDNAQNPFGDSSPTNPRTSAENRRRTVALPAEEDVCFPLEGMSEMAEDEYNDARARRRSRRKEWPDLEILDDWATEEKEARISEGIRTKKISEPVLVGGRLRPQKSEWHKTEEDAPYRFTYFNEEFPSTIHSQTISELLQSGQTFRDLFIPDPPELSDESSDEEDQMSNLDTVAERNELSPGGQSRTDTRQSSVIGDRKAISKDNSGEATPAPSHQDQPQPQPQNSRKKPKKYGTRPTFWLDVLSPTDAEMRAISKTFGIHPLTAEDILVQEAREKVELFRNYYFVNYRTFEQDVNSSEYLEPINMYVVVFREGVISFHFSLSPHPANVRRRIRQLKDYLILSSDWISYAIIDDITDVFAPLIQGIEDEVDDIDDAILQLHDPEPEPMVTKKKPAADDEKRSEAGQSPESGSDMLRRVGRGRKKVMGMYRLLGNKADVIKGFAKRCNEQWEIAPRSEIGLYLGDIQDHILTMTSNLNHYETLLSRAHSNYLAQINIRMNERQEQTSDILGKLTVLGTIVLPLNIVSTYNLTLESLIHGICGRGDLERD
ncbi:CorA metal ion transporter [Agyrium rufum]|nr:CorA metal ion transporter [Agyrium rufum]